MARPRAKVPARQYHISGQSVVQIGGRTIYLGPHDSAEAIARYAVLLGIYQANEFALPADFDTASLEERVTLILGAGAPSAIATDQTSQPILVRHVTAAFRYHTVTKYAKAPTEKGRYDQICKLVDEFDGDGLADKFGPVKLKRFRDNLVERGLSRKYINKMTNSVIVVFKHAVSSELIGVTILQRLQTIDPLRKGQTTAPDHDAIEPANLFHVRATAKHLSPIVKAMLRIQICTGMRPKELRMMRPCDIDRSGPVWIYRPSNHKTAWCGKTKAIPLIEDARDAITDYLQRDPESYCFSPAESVAWRRAVGTANRKTPPNQGNARGRKLDGGGLRGAAGKRLPRTQYTTTSYHQAIKRAAKKAGVPHWFPYQLRHLTATVVRAALGIEEAQALLGHSTAAMTAHYALESIEAATKAAKAAPKL